MSEAGCSPALARQPALLVGLHAWQAASGAGHLQNRAGDGLFWHKTNGWKVHFFPEQSTASSEHRSAPSPLPDHLPFCSSLFGLRKEREGAAKPSAAPINPHCASQLGPACSPPNMPGGFCLRNREQVSRVCPERVKGSRPFQPGEVELVTAFSRSAGQVIKMTNEHKSIMKLVFSGNARHERKSTSTRVVGAMMCRMSCPTRAPLPRARGRWHRPFLLPITFDFPLAPIAAVGSQDGSAHRHFPVDFWCLLEQSLRDAGCRWMLVWDIRDQGLEMVPWGC